MKPRLPDYREKQKVIYIDNSPKEVLITYGDRCRSADRIFDALEFYQKAKHKTGLMEIVAAAISSGDAMLLEQAAKALGTSPTVGEWDRLGRRAMALKKHLFARYAFEKSGDQSMLEEIRKIVEGGNSRPDDHNA